MKSLFMGTPDFGIGCLEILNEKTEVVGVVSQPDRPKGRGHKLVPTPIKQKAEELGLPVFQPETLKNEAFLDTLSKLNPDIIIVVAYGKILPSYILDYPRLGCINVHASLLPKLRGAAPIQRSIMNGDTVTGVTTMMMDKGLDTGDMLLKCEVPISYDETGGGLFQKLAEAGATLLADTLFCIENGTLVRTPQNHDEFTYAPMLDKETARIDWSDSGDNIRNLVRALNPMPLAFTVLNDKVLKILEVSVCDKKLAAGVTGDYDKTEGLPVGCGDGSVFIKTVKPEGKGAMSIHDYMRGHNIPSGTKFQ